MHSVLPQSETMAVMSTWCRPVPSHLPGSEVFIHVFILHGAREYEGGTAIRVIHPRIARSRGTLSPELEHARPDSNWGGESGAPVQVAIVTHLADPARDLWGKRAALLVEARERRIRHGHDEDPIVGDSHPGNALADVTVVVDGVG